MITIDLGNGRRTTAIQYEAVDANVSRARVVLAHGAGAGQHHPFIVNVARRLAALGIETVTFNFPYVEENRRAPDRTEVLEHCFRRVIGHVHPPNGRTLVIGGKSMGGRLAAQLAAQGAPIGGIFALGYPLHPPGKPTQLRIAHLPAITVPMLIVQGERDAFGTPRELEPVIAAMHTRVDLEVVAGGDHSLAVRGQPSDELYDWLTARLAAWVQTL